jgi:hypothetical protein
MVAQTWKTNWANIDQSGDPQRYVGQMAAIRKQQEEMVDIPSFLTFCDLQWGSACWMWAAVRVGMFEWRHAWWARQVA